MKLALILGLILCSNIPNAQACGRDAEIIGERETPFQDVLGEEAISEMNRLIADVIAIESKIESVDRSLRDPNLYGKKVRKKREFRRGLVKQVNEKLNRFEELKSINGLVFGFSRLSAHGRLPLASDRSQKYYARSGSNSRIDSQSRSTSVDLAE